MFSGLFRRQTGREEADCLYRAIVEQARQPGFYTDLGVPDTPDGRFDLILLHAVLVFRRLHRQRAATEGLAQVLFDLMFADMDQNLREMGVGDLAVGKRVKAMAKGFYGRLAAYGEALDGAEPHHLADALRRNVFRNRETDADRLARLAAYVRRQEATLAACPIETLMAGTVAFGPPPAPE